jgi:hypothetical protein
MNGGRKIVGAVHGFHSHARRFFNHLFDSELGLHVHRQAGDFIHNWAIM